MLNTQNNLSIAQTIYDNLSPYPRKNEQNNDEITLDEDTLLESAYEYIEAQEMTNSDIRELDEAFKKIPNFLLNVQKWHEKKEESKLKKYPHLL